MKIETHTGQPLSVFPLRKIAETTPAYRVELPRADIACPGAIRERWHAHLANIRRMQWLKHKSSVNTSSAGNTTFKIRTQTTHVHVRSSRFF